MDKGSCEMDSGSESEMLISQAGPTGAFTTTTTGTTTTIAGPGPEALLGPNIKIAHRPYCCKVPSCGKKYKNLNGLKYHAKTAHPEMDFKSEVKLHKSMKMRAAQRSATNAMGLMVASPSNSSA
jgi:hypothetical protein